MSITKFFTGSVASAAVLAATSVTTSVVLPAAPAQARSSYDYDKPDSCRRLDNLRASQASREDYRNERNGRDVGNAIRNGTRRGRNVDVGDIALGAAGGLLGGIAEQQTYNRSDTSAQRRLADQCAYEMAEMEAGVCVTDQRETGYIDTRNGRMVGDARGSINQRRQCTSRNVGSGTSILTPNGDGGSYQGTDYTPAPSSSRGDYNYGAQPRNSSGRYPRTGGSAASRMYGEEQRMRGAGELQAPAAGSSFSGAASTDCEVITVRNAGRQLKCNNADGTISLKPIR